MLMQIYEIFYLHSFNDYRVEMKRHFDEIMSKCRFEKGFFLYIGDKYERFISTQVTGEMKHT